MTTTQSPSGAGLATAEPLKCEGPGHHPEANADHQSTAGQDPTDDGDGAQTAAKRFETLRAVLALRGFELREVRTGGWLIVRWNMTRHVTDLDAAEAFARTVGAAR